MVVNLVRVIGGGFGFLELLDCEFFGVGRGVEEG